MTSELECRLPELIQPACHQPAITKPGRYAWIRNLTSALPLPSSGRQCGRGARSSPSRRSFHGGAVPHTHTPVVVCVDGRVASRTLEPAIACGQFAARPDPASSCSGWQYLRRHPALTNSCAAPKKKGVPVYGDALGRDVVELGGFEPPSASLLRADLHV